MKKIPLIVFVSLLLLQSVFAQYPVKWYRMNTGINTNINFIMPPYALGDNGNLLLWNGQREKWNVTHLGVNRSLLTYFSGIIAGESGTIFRYSGTDTAWSSVTSGTTLNINSSCGYHEFISNADIILVACDSSRVYYSYDGNLWQALNTGITGRLKMNSIAVNKPYGFNPFRTVIACDSGTVYYGTPFGSYSRVKLPYAGNLNSAAFSDTATVFIAGDNGLLLVSSDSGENWTRVYTGSEDNLKSVSFSSDLSQTPPRFYGIAAGSNGTCYITTDRGATWTREQTGVSVNFKGCSADASDGTFYTAGNDGSIYKRTCDSLYWYSYRFMPNNIKTTVVNDGTFNSAIQNNGVSQPGFQWPKDSSTYSVFTSGFNLFANVNGVRKMAAASFRGEYRPGTCVNGVVDSDSKFKIYKVRKNGSVSDYDYANWYKMVPYGAPYYDMNHNGIYETGIDLPGVKGASETVFLCMTDGNPQSHSASTGFGGGTQPLFADVRVTMWGYDDDKFRNVILMKYEIINGSPQENRYAWDSVYASFFYDFDIGNGFDNYMSCDSLRHLAYGYCAYDSTSGYGKHPPAVGMSIMQGLSLNGIPLRSTSAIRLHNYNTDPVVCEREPGANLGAAINVMKGYKNDGTKWIIPYSDPVRLTKYSFSGNPETWAGWTTNIGRVNNCGCSLTGQVIPEYYMDTRFVLSTGSDNIKILPGDTQVVYASQLIARGSNNKNSVTRLKALSDSIQAFYKSGFSISDSLFDAPVSFELMQNYPNPFNSSTKIRFTLKGAENVNISVYDVSGRLAATLVKGDFVVGIYETVWDASAMPSGVYFLRMSSKKYTATKKMVLVK